MQSKGALSAVFIVLAGLLSATPGTATRYVSTTGSDAGNDCTSSGAPCETIQWAVDQAGVAEEVRVAAGTYTGSQTVTVTRSTVDYDYRQVVFIDQEMILQGGYTDLDWNNSDPVANPTVIDAAGDGRPITVVDTNTDLVVIGGFTLTGGDYTGLGNPTGIYGHVCRDPGEYDCGGGLYVYRSAIELRDAVVSANVASTVAGTGGGIYLWQARDSLIDNVTVSGNSGFYAGGGLLVNEQYFPLTISGSRFETNTADRGGGIDLVTNIEALVRIEDSIVTGNSAAIGDGGGVYANMTTDGLVLDLDRVIFENNDAWGLGKAMWIDAAGPVTPEARLINVRFSGNAPTSGAPLTAQDAVLVVASDFTSLGATLAHVTAADNSVASFLYARPDTNPGRTVIVTAANVLLQGFDNGYAAEESGSGEATIVHTNTLFHQVTNQHSTVAGSPTFTAIDPVTGDPLLDADYRIQSGSAAHDAGTDAGVTSDLDGEYRPQGTAPDIGSDELYQLVAPTSVTITGPSTAVVNAATEFQADVSPVEATQPLTYTWEATDLTPVVHDGGLSDTASFIWTTPGEKTVQVTVTNAAGDTSDSHAVTVVTEPILGIIKSGPPEAIVGTDITYTITIENTGGVAATGLVITDTVPTGATFVEAQDGGTHDAGVVTWNVASLGSAASVDVHFVVSATETIVNDTYAVTADGGYGAVGTVPVTTVFGEPLLSITKTGPLAASPGEDITYELTVGNSGDIAATNLEVADTLPTGATWVSGGTLDGGVVRWQAASLAAGSEVMFSFTVQASDTIVNDTYSVSADGGYGAVGTDVVTTIVAAGTRYVSTTGADPVNDCTSSAAPCATIQWAVDVAAPGEQVRVAAGTYTGSQTVTVTRFTVDYDYRQVVFIDKQLSVLGGYTELDWNNSDPVANPTVIDAAGDGRPITVVDTNTNLVVVGGFTLTGGDYTGLGNPSGIYGHVCRDPGEYDCGGGLYVYLSAIELRDSIVDANVASTVNGTGGGIYLWLARESLLDNVTVTGNSGLYAGGGLLVNEQYLPLTIRGSRFEGNTAHRGGGIDLVTNIEALVRIEDSAIIGNSATLDDGGGLYANLTADGRMLEIERVWFADNEAWAQGKGAQIDAAGPVTPEAKLTNVLFSGNGPVTGAPIAPADAALAITSSFTSLGAILEHVTAADNPVSSFLFARPDSDPGRTLLVTATNVLLQGFENGYVGEEVGSGQVTIEHTKTLFHQVTNQHLVIGGSPTITAIDPVSGDPLLDPDYRLQWGSAALDIGADAGVLDDIDGDLRPQGLGPDIGADELALIFADGFESGDTSAWSVTVP